MRYLVEPPPEDAGPQRSFKYPFTACEIFCCEVEGIFNTLLENEDLLAQLFSLLEVRWSLPVCVCVSSVCVQCMCAVFVCSVCSACVDVRREGQARSRARGRPGSVWRCRDSSWRRITHPSLAAAIPAAAAPHPPPCLRTCPVLPCRCIRRPRAPSTACLLATSAG